MAKNHNKLRGKIVEVFGKIETYAEEMGISSATASMKLSGERGFKQKEIKKTAELLQIPKEEIWDYFFAE